MKCRRNISQMAEFSIRFMRDKRRQDEARGISTDRIYETGEVVIDYEKKK